MKEDLLIQDDESYMTLHKHHPFSIGRGSKYINAMHFFVVDKMEKKEFRMVHFTTAKIIADYSTKPTQEKVFTLHRNTIMGVSEKKYKTHKQWHRESLERHD